MMQTIFSRLAGSVAVFQPDPAPVTTAGALSDASLRGDAVFESEPSPDAPAAAVSDPSAGIAATTIPTDPAMPIAVAGPTELGAATALNAELIAALPRTGIDALMPEGRAVQPEQSFAKVPGTSTIGDWFKPPMWRDTIGGARESGGELVRRPSLKKLATGGAQAAAGATDAELGPKAITRNLLQRAAQAGLSKEELAQLETALHYSSIAYGTFEADAATVAAVLDTANAARGLRTYINLDVQRRFLASDRITSEVVYALSVGVGRSRTGAGEGSEGILSIETANYAAAALAEMSADDYQRIVKTLHAAGGSYGPTVAFGVDAQTERALILKAVGARYESFTAPLPAGGGLLSVMPPALQIEQFAAQIRGVNAHTLIERTSGIDLDGDGVDEAIRQGQSGSEAAVLQMVRAEADPIYAWALYNDPADYLTLPALEDALSPSTRNPYERHAVTDSYVGRAAAADRIAQELERGADVPIAITSNGGGTRAMLITDVRGSGTSQQFLVTDPRNGRTEWVSRKAITDGNLGGSGAKLSGYWL